MRRRLSLLVVIALGSLALVVPGAAAGGGCHGDPDVEMSGSTRRTVAIGACAFVDTVTYVRPGDSVTWVNKDPVPHSVTGAALSWGDDRLLDTAERVTYEFESEGVFPYYCALHPTMVGAVVVGDGAAPAGFTGGAAGVEKVDPAAKQQDPAPTTSRRGMLMPATVALSIIAALGAAVIGWRQAAKRRAGITPAA